MEMTELRNGDERVYRFFCRCGIPDHVLEISTYDGQLEIGFCAGGSCALSLWPRIKRAFRHVFRLKDTPWSEFLVRPEDEEEILEVITEFRKGREE